jgi:hypothetical protein
MLSLRPKTIKVKPGDKLLGARVFNDLGPATKDTLLKQKLLITSIQPLNCFCKRAGSQKYKGY